MAVSQNGWPASPDPHAIGVASFSVDGVSFPGGIKAGSVATVLGHVLDQFHRRVENLVSGWCWGYNYRTISGSSQVSNHGSGTAADANAPTHPLGKRGTFNAAQVAEIHRILSEVDNVVRWGGDYSGRVDEMHFEITATPAQVDAVAGRLSGGGGPTPPPPPNPGGHATVRRGSTGPDVALVQRYLGLPADGIFGPATETAVKRYQNWQGLTADGIVGPRTWQRILAGLGNNPAPPGGGGGGASAHPTIRRGSTGEAVKLIQRWLGVTADGTFGPATEAAVIRYQRMKGLTADGIVGPRTWAATGL